MTSPLPEDFNAIEPTGLDYHAAFWALYPGVAQAGGRVHELSDHPLRLVSKAARLRRTERERVKAAFREVLDHLDREDSYAASLIKSALEEIR